MHHAKEKEGVDENDRWAEGIADEFFRAARGKDGCYHLSCGLHSLQMHATKDAPRISVQDTNTMLHACGSVAKALPILFPDELRQQAAQVGIVGADALIRFWGEPPGVRKHWSRHGIYEAGLAVRWLRNECHNMSIMDELIRRGGGGAIPEPRCDEARRSRGA
jgi:hypothetical protein